MKRKPNAIFGGDFHLRDSIPICRTDDFVGVTQWRKLDFISDIQKTYNIPVYHSGDLFHNWKPSPFLISKAIEHLPAKFHTVYGNHDLPQHNLELAYKSGIHTLEKAGKLTVLPRTHWGMPLQKPSIIYSKHAEKHIVRQIAVWHVMTYQGKMPWPGCTDPKSNSLIRKYKKFDIILTGHNHKTFVEQFDNRLLINPGSLTRQEADTADHRPCIFLYYAYNNTYEKVYIPIENNVISQDHLIKQRDRDSRIDAFVARLDTEHGLTGLTFEQNLEKLIQENEIRQSVQNIIQKSIEISN